VRSEAPPLPPKVSLVVRYARPVQCARSGIPERLAQVLVLPCGQEHQHDKLPIRWREPTSLHVKRWQTYCMRAKYQ
jgi:hypothetical protein